MSFSESGSGFAAGSALAALSNAYSHAPIEVGESVPAASDATGGAEEHVQDADAASQPAATEAPIPTEPADSGTAEAAASETGQPFRVFATEDEYRSHLDGETKRQREAQAASARESQTLKDELAGLQREKQALEEFRNEIYARSQSEELTPQMIVESFMRRDGESKVQFEARKAEAVRAQATEAQREDIGRIVQAGSENATKALLLERVLDLKDELGDVPGLNVKGALEKAIRESPEAQRHVTDSYNAMKRDPATGLAVPDIERREYAQKQAYKVGFELVRKQATTIKNALTTRAAEVLTTPATSIVAPATLGQEVRRYSSPIEAMSAGYAKR